MRLFVEKQLNPIASEVTALISIVRPILLGTLYGLRQDIAKEVGGHSSVKVKMLPRLYRPGDGDIGICFEWAVHDAIKRQEPLIMDRLETASRKCKLRGTSFASLLFGAEKAGVSKLIDTANDILTDDSRLLTGEQAQPVKLKRYLNQLSAAFRRPETRLALPYSINGLWKADLFFGTTDQDRWLGTTLKINPSHLEGARGLRIGIVPASQGAVDAIILDERKNLVICPLPYDGSFMELFYTGWRIVQQFLKADAQLPSEAALPNPPERQVARELAMRREFPVEEVVDVLDAQAQPNLMERSDTTVSTSVQREGDTQFNDTLITPVSRVVE